MKARTMLSMSMCDSHTGGQNSEHTEKAAWGFHDHLQHTHTRLRPQEQATVPGPDLPVVSCWSDTGNQDKITGLCVCERDTTVRQHERMGGPAWRKPGGQTMGLRWPLLAPVSCSRPSRYAHLCVSLTPSLLLNLDSSTSG